MVKFGIESISDRCCVVGAEHSERHAQYRLVLFAADLCNTSVVKSMSLKYIYIYIYIFFLFILFFFF